MSPKHVDFSTIEIIEFPMTLGCNPSVSSGAPVTIEWEPQHRVRFDLDVFEEHRPKRRHRRELPIDPFIREQILVDSGIGLDQIIFWRESSAENDIKKPSFISKSFKKAMKLSGKRQVRTPQKINHSLFQLSGPAGLSGEKQSIRFWNSFNFVKGRITYCQSHTTCALNETLGMILLPIDL